MVAGLAFETLLGRSMVFDRSGQTLLVVEPKAISVIRLSAGGETTRFAIRDARAVAAFADQLWIAHDDQLSLIDYTGRLVASRRSLLSSTRATLQPAPCGRPAAIWSSNPVLALVHDLGQLAATALADVENAFPLTGHRFVTVRGEKLTLPSGLVTMLPPNTMVLGGTVMSDGKSVTLLVANGSDRQLIVVSLGTGQVTQRHAAPPAMVRIAIRRSLALLQLEPRLLGVLDLHAGRETGTALFDDDVADFVIDPDGHRVAVRYSDGAIELHLLDLLRRRLAAGRSASAMVDLALEARRSGCPTRNDQMSGPPFLSLESASSSGATTTSMVFDVSDSDEQPTLNIRRPRLRTPPSLARTSPDIMEEVDRDVITSASRSEGHRR